MSERRRDRECRHYPFGPDRPQRHVGRRGALFDRCRRGCRPRPDLGRGARAGGVLPRPSDRAARRHRDLLHGARARPSAAPGSTPTRRPAPRWRTCWTWPRRWPTRTHWPGWTTAAARRSSSVTRAPTRPSRCCARTAGSSPPWAGGTSPPATWARTWRTWTWSPASRRCVTGRSESTAAPATPPC